MTTAKKAQARPMAHGVADSLPPEVQALLREHIESYEQLETLLLLRARPLGWSPHAVAAELHITEALAEEACCYLCRQELLESISGTGGPLFKYGSVAPELDVAIGRLATAYMDQRLEVIRSMTANALDRLRLKSLALFSDAFRLRKRSG